MTDAAAASGGDGRARDVGLQATLDEIVEVEGWLTADQARRLWRAAAAAPSSGRVVEIGSFRGRSAIVLARAAAPGVEVVAIDPHRGGDRGPREIAVNPQLGEADHAAFAANLAAAGVAHRVRHVRERSHRALGAVSGEIDVLYVDGAHRYRPARADLRLWGERVRQGGRLLVHDSFSSVGVTLALLTTLAGRAGWRYLGRTGSLAEFERGRAAPRERARDLGRVLLALPWFARNLVVKLALVARLRLVARALGHRSGPWPY